MLRFHSHSYISNTPDLYSDLSKKAVLFARRNLLPYKIKQNVTCIHIMFHICPVGLMFNRAFLCL